MSSQNQRLPAVKHAGLALAKIGDLGLLPTPYTYALFFKYFEGSSRELNERLDIVLRSDSPLTDDAVYSFYLEYCLTYGDNIKVSTLAGLVADELGALMDLWGDASRSTSDYQNTLEAASGQLENKMSSREVSAIVGRLIAETKSVAAYSRRIEEKLSESTTVIDSLTQELESARRKATTDSLTGLANRSEFQRIVTAAIAAAEPQRRTFSVLMVDIDHFKKVNDTFGHPVGDKVLKLTASTLMSNTKGKDLAARYGGEEFAIYLADATLEQAVSMAESLRQAVSAQSIVNKATGQACGTVTVSIGVAAYHPGRTLDDLVERADQALYRAKNTGRNRVCAEDDGQMRWDLAAVS